MAAEKGWHKGLQKMTPAAAAMAAAAFFTVAVAVVMHILRLLQLWPMCEHGLSTHGNRYVSC